MGRDYGEHGRCEAQSKQTGERCKQPEKNETGKCHYHGGATPIKNGIYSPVVRDKDREILNKLEDIETAQKLEETLNLQIMKLRRAVELADNPDGENFWDMFGQLVDSAADGGELDATVVRELTKMLEAPGRTQRELMDLIRKTAKDLHSIREGEDVNVNHSVDSEELQDLKEQADDLF